MKIQCSVCDKDEATVYCVADEAALCDACDRRVHHANKLAGKHPRFSLLQPSPKDTPLCDICQEKRAFLFCQQDKAILCRECDIPIHKANDLTRSHNRFFLTGLKLSAASSTYPSSSSINSPSNLSVTVPTFNPKSNSSLTKKSVPLCAYQHPTSKPTPPQEQVASANNCCDDHTQLIPSGFTSSFSDYLMDMLPGWRVEDFLDDDDPSSLKKGGGDEVVQQPYWGGENEIGQNLYSFSENTTLWVPQVPTPPEAMSTKPNQTYSSSLCVSETPFEEAHQMSFFFKDPKDSTKASRELSDDNCFAVPQISPHGFKRSRTLW